MWNNLSNSNRYNTNFGIQQQDASLTNPKNVGNDFRTEQWEAIGKILRRMGIVSAASSDLFLSDEETWLLFHLPYLIYMLLSQFP